MGSEQKSGAVARFLERRRGGRRRRGPKPLSWDEAAERAAEDLRGGCLRDRPLARRRSLKEAAKRAADYLEGR